MNQNNQNYFNNNAQPMIQTEQSGYLSAVDDNIYCEQSQQPTFLNNDPVTQPLSYVPVQNIFPQLPQQPAFLNNDPATQLSSYATDQNISQPLNNISSNYDPYIDQLQRTINLKQRLNDELEREVMLLNERNRKLEVYLSLIKDLRS
jgi:hypothetical protein